ncbi:MAG: hypothetical protein ACI4F4_08920 [Lachnospiraceae bacterium]
MYIRKKLYYLIKVLCIIGTYFWGFLSVTLVIGMLLDLLTGDNAYLQADVPFILSCFGTIWIAHILFKQWIEHARVYDGLFSNDADGILQTKVIARALGMEEKKVISEINLLCKFQLLKNCSLQVIGEKSMVVLFNGDNGQMQIRTVVCPHCGGENYLRSGFVQSCRYCEGKLDS